jgi:sec-independent protein translocase protein TatB
VEFLGVGYQEILVILAIMLVVVGPDRLPTMAYQIGRAVRTLQQYARAVRDEFSDEFEYLDEQMKTVKGGMSEFNQTMREGERDLRKDLGGVAPAQLLSDEKPSNVVPFGNIHIDGKPVPNAFGEPAAQPLDGGSAGEAIPDGESPAAPVQEAPVDGAPKAPLVF